MGSVLIKLWRRQVMTFQGTEEEVRAALEKLIVDSGEWEEEFRFTEEEWNNEDILKEIIKENVNDWKTIDSDFFISRDHHFISKDCKKKEG